jgi:general secretion pathway protein I
MPSDIHQPIDPTQSFAANNGFTLIEVLIAMSIVAIALTAVYRLHSQTLAMANATVFYATEPLLAQQNMVSLQFQPADELTDVSGDFSDRHPGYHWTATINDVESEFLERTKEDLKRVDVTVSFDGDGQAFSLRRYLLIRE